MLIVIEKWKWTAPLDFSLQVSFINQFTPSPRVFHLGCFEFFWKIRRDISSSTAQGAPQGLGGRWFMKRTWSTKFLDTVPLNGWNGIRKWFQCLGFPLSRLWCRQDPSKYWLQVHSCTQGSSRNTPEKKRKNLSTGWTSL